MKTIVGLFDTMEQAKKAALDLEAAGIAHNDISLVANNESGQHAAHTTATAAPTVSGHAIGHDAVVGAEIGGGCGPDYGGQLPSPFPDSAGLPGRAGSWVPFWERARVPLSAALSVP